MASTEANLLSPPVSSPRRPVGAGKLGLLVASLAVLLLGVALPGLASADDDPIGTAWRVVKSAARPGVLAGTSGAALRGPGECTGGRIALEPTACCWPGQHSDAGICVGPPTCPRGFEALGATCVAPQVLRTALGTTETCSPAQPRACVAACEVGEGAACRDLALGLRAGAIAPQPGVAAEALAAELLLRACYLGDARACKVTAAQTPTERIVPSQTGRAGRIALEWLVGTVGAGLGAVIGGAAALSLDDPSTTGAVVGGFAATALTGLGVWGIGEALDGDGSILWTYAGSAVGVGTSLLLIFAQRGSDGEAFIWTAFVLPAAGAILGYELSSSIEEADATRQGFSASVGPLLGGGTTGIGVVGRF